MVSVLSPIMVKDIQRNYSWSELQNDLDTVIWCQGKGNCSGVPAGWAFRWIIGAFGESSIFLHLQAEIIHRHLELSCAIVDIVKCPCKHHMK
jgi:hypothetical protein